MILSISQIERNFLRKQSLFSGFTSLIITSLFFFPDFPFDRKICLITALFSLMYFSFYVFFDLISKYRDIVIVFMSNMALVFIGMAVHWSGGIVSPFVILYFCIVLSESAYGIEKTLTIIVAVSSYVLVVGGECFGFLEVSNSFSEKIYSSGLVAWIIISMVASFIVVTGYISKLLMFRLKLDIEREHEEKEAALKKYTELNSYSQIGFLSHRISHDLRGMFFVLSSYFEMQSEKSEEEEKDKKVIVEHLQRMKYMISQITKYGKPSMDEEEKINPVEFVENMITIVKLFEGARTIIFKTRFPDNHDFYVFGSRQEFQNAYFNIFKNAIEAMSEIEGEKIIEINVLKSEKEVKIVISDNGRGIDEEFLPKLFIDPVTSKKDGTGIGLFIIKRIFDQNDSSIKIERRGNHGTMVITKIPLYSK
ncbi:MAG: HAMP domain-containing histidine kinase [Elusimicrobiales bacterium]|nr:HAMP domain-containing histidine kinase [Elusimicrobiales bacterium]